MFFPRMLIGSYSQNPNVNSLIVKSLGDGSDGNAAAIFFRVRRFVAKLQDFHSVLSFFKTRSMVFLMGSR